jgi:hypothetical protein
MKKEAIGLVITIASVSVPSSYRAEASTLPPITRILNRFLQEGKIRFR